MDKYICIHGHFYQPPRENPWLEEIELQDSARPYHDWNERITAESYAPNAYARVLLPDGKIADIVNNFARISFNIGPTLFQWLEHNQPDVYRRILKADRDSRDRFSGHGSALAQAHNHLIMPLANSRDKRTQILWGIADFEYRFERRPEGMWLPETAVDLEKLDIMAEQGILFTILSPYQAARTRPAGESKWNDVHGGKVNTQVAYRCALPSGRSIALFFYDGKVSQEIAFGQLLSDGQRFAERLLGGFPKEAAEARLVHVATDGETYGHHNHFADMALAWCIQEIEKREDVHLTIYGEFLEKTPPAHEVEIFENTSWSCAHGVERWRSNCGDNTGMHRGWQQEWRAPLRNALNWLRDEFIPIYEREASVFLKNPWQARDSYIEVILNRAPERVVSFFARHAARDLTREDMVTALRLLEMQRHAMLMFTSCGWFFDEISGIETTQVMYYAKRAMQIVREQTGEDCEPQFMRMLADAPSNIPEYINGSRVYERFVKPMQVDLHRVGAHFIISSFFKDYPEISRIFSYTVISEARSCYEVGIERLITAKLKIISEITWEESTVDAAVVYLGAHNFYGGIMDHTSMAEYSAMRRNIQESFLRGDIPETITRISLNFEHRNYSLWHLFRDEQRDIFDRILQTTLQDIHQYFRQTTDRNYLMIKAMHRMGVPIPSALSIPLEFTLNNDLELALESEDMDIPRIRKIVESFSLDSVEPDLPILDFAANRKISGLVARLSRNPYDISLLRTINALFQTIRPLNLGQHVWESQNCYLEIGKKYYMEQREKALSGDPEAEDWVAAFDEMKEYLYIGEAEYALHELNV